MRFEKLRNRLSTHLAEHGDNGILTKRDFLELIDVMTGDAPSEPAATPSPPVTPGDADAAAARLKAELDEVWPLGSPDVRAVLADREQQIRWKNDALDEVIKLRRLKPEKLAAKGETVRTIDVCVLTKGKDVRFFHGEPDAGDFPGYARAMHTMSLRP